MKNAERKVWIDIAKAIGSIAVVAGHIGGITPDQFSLIRMPLFLFTAGFLFKPVDNLVIYLQKKTIHLLVPYLSFLLLIYPFQAYDFYVIHQKSITSIIVRFFSGGLLLPGITGVFWFITVLFFTQQIFNFIITQYGRSTTRIIIILTLFIAIGQQFYFAKILAPWAIDKILIGLPYFWLGYEIKKINVISIQVLIASIAVLAIAYIVETLFKVNLLYINLKKTNYGFPVLTLISSIAAVLLIYNFSHYIEKVPVSKWVIQFGKAAMIVLYLHQPIQYLLRNSPLFENGVFLLISTLTICFFIYQAVSKFWIGRALLLGSSKDFENLVFWLKNKKNQTKY